MTFGTEVKYRSELNDICKTVVQVISVILLM